MKAKRRRRALEVPSKELKEQELELLRESKVLDQSVETLEWIRPLEIEVREASRSDSIKWHKRSRICWLSIGEAPTRYCFAQYKAKHSRETLHNIRIDDNNVSESDFSNRAHFYSFYQELFMRDGTVEHNRVERATTLTLTNKRLSLADNEIFL